MLLLFKDINTETNKTHDFFEYINKDEVKQLFLSNAFLDLKNINIIGLMGMATYTENNNLIRSEFKTLSALFNDLKQSLAPQFSELSIGMSNDYKIAKEEGSTLVRIGTYIFGERDYGI